MNVIIHMHVRLMHTERATTKARLKKCAMSGGNVNPPVKCQCAKEKTLFLK